MQNEPVFSMNNDLLNNTRTIHLDYGDVEVGKVAVKTIDVWNESCREHIYQVQRDPTTNPLDHVFHLRSYTWTLAPEEKFVCEIRYGPLVASSHNVDYFFVTDTSGGCMRIVARGSSIGPKVICSATNVIMNCTIENPEVKRRIKLINNSKVAATFMLKMDEKYKPFRIDTKYGVIAPCSHKYITITFTSQKERAYTYYLVVLILHHEPIIIDLHGCCISNSVKKAHSNDISYPLQERNGFNVYIRDSVDNLGNLPPVSLSKHYFNFGQAEVDVENVIQRIPLAVCLTNHNNLNLFISWEKDSDGIFAITPSEIQLRGNQWALFELTFNPDLKNNLFGRELICSVFMEETGVSSFPFVTSITAIGHSFPVTSNGWIPQYEIPQTVIMPPCVPPTPVYATFSIKKFGHLPLMFQFVSPPSSHFAVKPMLGLIHGSFQIIVVEMVSELKDEQIYIERWSIYFNGNPKNEGYIDFKGYAECANITFNVNNTLIFQPVLPGCQQYAQLAMRNVTRHRINYQFYQLPPELLVQHTSGQIEPNIILCQECFFSPTEPNVDYDFEVQCVLTVVRNEVIIGSISCIDLRVRGRCELGLLEALPQELNFDEVEYNYSKTLTFDLVNSSSVNIYYKLISTHLNLPLENIDEDVKMYPDSETIFSGSHKKIRVSITPRTPVYYQFAIQYLIRINFRSDTLVAGQAPVKLCNVYCMCVLPTIKVQNICAFGCKQDFSVNTSKPYLWRALQINRLNETLENIVPGDRKTIDIQLFPVIINQGSVLIEWTMSNPSLLPASLILKKIKQCSCQPVMKPVGLSRQRIDINCVHRDVCIVHQETTTLNPGQTTVVGMDISFGLIGKTTFSWDLDIGHDRHIILNMLMNCLTETDAQDKFLTSELINFGNIYFGNKDAAYKAIWIYNVTNNDLSYSVDVGNIRKMNEHYHCEIFTCLSQDGIVKSQTPVTLLFRFQPRMFGAFKVTLAVTVGDRVSELTLKGEASSDIRSICVGNSFPYCSCKTVYFPAYFNIDCIDTWRLPMHTHFAKMILIYNDLDYDTLGFEWICRSIPEIIDIDVFPRKGILRPHAARSFRIRIFTKGCPCRINVSVACIFFNASLRREYQRSVIKHRILSEELEGQFVITEMGTSVPEPWIKVLDKPEPYHKALSLRCTIYSTEDESTRVSLLEQLKATPSNMIFIDYSKNDAVVKDREHFIITFILEGMIWDIVNSKQFQTILEESLTPARNLYYSQFMMDLWNRRRLVKRSYISSPLTIIESVLEKILYLIVHEEFVLDTFHLFRNEDIRHRDYLKLLPKEKRTDIEDIRRRLMRRERETREEDGDSKHNLRTRFRVSFTD